MATLKLNIQVDSNIIDAAKVAASNKGIDNLDEYILDLIKSDAIKASPYRESITLDNEDFDRFVNACLDAPPPSRELKEAYQRMIEMGIQ